MSETPYNPLEKVHLAESIRRALEESPTDPLPPAERFTGTGIYAIYYTGPFDLYLHISDAACRTPIYVGSALPAGGGTGHLGLETPVSRRLFGRLSKHSRSIDDVKNLELEDFRSRHLLVDDVWTSLGEQYLIGLYRPLWNSKVLRGFGINAPGAGRAGQRRSLWDTLHPGRTYAKDLPSAETPLTEIERNVGAYLAGELDPEGLEPEPSTEVESDDLG